MSNLSPREILDTMLGYLGFVFEIEEQERDGHKVLQIFTHEADLLIGRREQTLDDLQFLLNRILQAGDPKSPRVVVDVDHHRAMRDDALIAKVRHLARGRQEHRAPASDRTAQLLRPLRRPQCIQGRSRCHDVESPRRCQAQAHHHSAAQKNFLINVGIAAILAHHECARHFSLFRFLGLVAGFAGSGANHYGRLRDPFRRQYRSGHLQKE